jgi:hypothetical protein
LKVCALLVGLASAWTAWAQELVKLPTRPGVYLSFFIANMGERKPEAAALLLIGGGGNIRLRIEDGQPKFQQGNFLPRSRREFIRNGILPVILDNPTDQPSGEGMSDQFRQGPQHALDISMVAAEVKRRYPGLPVFLVGTSRSTISAAYVPKYIKGELAGTVLTSSYFQHGRGNRPHPVLADFDFRTIPIPLLFVHHADDSCHATPYQLATRAARGHTLITVHGGKPPEGPPCEPFSQHGYLGKEAETVDAIAAWMLGKPFSKDIR